MKTRTLTGVAKKAKAMGLLMEQERVKNGSPELVVKRMTVNSNSSPLLNPEEQDFVQMPSRLLWSEVEVSKLLDGLTRFGPDYEQISADFGTRTVGAISRKAYQLLYENDDEDSPEIKKVKESLE